MLDTLKSDEQLRREAFALSAKLKALQASDYQTDHKKAWKLAAKIRRLEEIVRSRQLRLPLVKL